MLTVLRWGGLVLSVLVSAGCSASNEGGGTSGTPGQPVPSSSASLGNIAVTPQSSSILTGQTQQYVAQVTDTNGQPMSGMTVTWSSSNQTVATISPSGLASGSGAGSTTITAAVGSVQSAGSALTVTSSSGGGDAGSLDEDGVLRLFASAPGTSFRLGSQNPNSASFFDIEYGMSATQQNGGGFSYWNTPAFQDTFSNGELSRTIRLQIRDKSKTQLYTWRNNPGYLLAPTDLKNLEFTAYVRIHDPAMDKPSVTMKIRGGRHDANPDDASCSMMLFGKGGNVPPAEFSKELEHPIYDDLQLTPLLPAVLQNNRWYGMKMVSYEVPGSNPVRVVNRLYLDLNPFNATGVPQNNWQLFSEYIDVDGHPLFSGAVYDKVVNWGGYQTSLRADHMDSLDFRLISAREIVPGF